MPPIFNSVRSQPLADDSKDSELSITQELIEIIKNDGLLPHYCSNNKKWGIAIL
jgi:hypothetical protein